MKMKITVRAFADYREIIGKEMELLLPAEKTIGGLLADLGDRYPNLPYMLFQVSPIIILLTLALSTAYSFPNS